MMIVKIIQVQKIRHYTRCTNLDKKCLEEDSDVYTAKKILKNITLNLKKNLDKEEEERNSDYNFDRRILPLLRQVLKK